MLHEYDDYLNVLRTAVGLAAYSPEPIKTEPGATMGFSACLISPADSSTSAVPPSIASLLGAVTNSVSVSVPKDPTLPSPVPTVGGGTRDAIHIIVTDWADTMLVGLLDYESLNALEGTGGVPWSIHLQTLFQTVRRGDWSVVYPAPAPQRGPGGKPSSVPVGSAGSPTSRGRLTIKSTNPVALLWECQLIPVLNRERRTAMIANLGRTMMRHHSTVYDMYEREKRNRIDAEETLARAYAGSGVGDPGRSKQKETGKASSPTKKPQSLLNPGQKVGSKRPRGVKIG